MNYLAHFVYNHRVLGLPADPYFVAGVMLPDLWPRLSRRRRIRWPAVRTATPPPGPVRSLQAGLLNHVAADAAFHTCGAFLNWQRTVRRALSAGGTASAARGSPARSAPGSSLDFLAHLAVELSLDRSLLRDDAAAADCFYDALAACDAERIEIEISRLGEVDATGLAGELAGFLHRRFLDRFADPDALSAVVRFVFSLTAAPTPPDTLIAEALDAADRCINPRSAWCDLPADLPAPQASAPA